MALLLLPLIPAPLAQAEGDITPPLKYEWGKPVSLTDTDKEVPDFSKEVLAPLKEQQAKRAAEEAEAQRKRDEQARLEAAQAALAAQPSQPYYSNSNRAYTASPAPYGGLRGQRGYAIAGGNCVNQVPHHLRAPGNPSSWPVTTYTPYIGGAALWHYNHVGRVVGIWDNGDLEIAHENWSGSAQTRFPRSTFRGYR